MGYPSKRRRNGCGSIRKHGKRYQIAVLVDGKRCYETVDTKTDAEARIRILSKSNNAYHQKMADGTSLLDFFIKEYCSFSFDSSLTNNTKASYLQIATGYILPLLGNKAISDIKPSDVEYFIECLKLSELSPKTIENMVSALSCILNIAMRRDLLFRNPCRCVKTPKVPRYNKTQFLDEDFEHFIRLCHNAADGDLYIIAMATGIRQSELIGLRWSDIDFKKQIIHVKNQLQYDRLNHTGRYNKTGLKDHQSRSITVARCVIDYLQKMREKQNQMLHEKKLHNTDGFVFLGKDGTHLKRSTVQKRFRRFMKTHPELPQKARFHDMRGSYATRMTELMDGEGDKIVSENLGHFSVAFTKDHYTCSSKTLRKKSADVQQDDLKDLL